MTSTRSLAGARPNLRTLIPVLLYTAGAEMLISRVLARGGMFWIRGGVPGPRLTAFLDNLGYTFFNFSVVMAIIVLVHIGVSARSLHLWPSPWMRWLGPGMAAFAIWSMLRAFFPVLAPQAAYQCLSLVLALGILAAFFATGEGAGGHAFAVLLAAALFCGAYAGFNDGLTRLGVPMLPWRGPARMAGELLALAAGAVAPGLIPRRPAEGPQPQAFRHAILAVIPTGLFFLIYARHEGTPFGSPRWSLGWTRELPLPEGFDGLLYAAVMFLFLFALFRCLGEGRWRVRGLGLAFLFLAGIHYQIAYQHLLGLIGLVLVTRRIDPPSAPEPPSPEPATADAV